MVYPVSRQGLGTWVRVKGPPLNNTLHLSTLFCCQSFGQGWCENTFQSIVLKSLEHEESRVQLYRNSSKVIVLFCCEGIPIGQSRFLSSPVVLNCLWRGDNSVRSPYVTVVMGMACMEILEIPSVSFIHAP